MRRVFSRPRYILMAILVAISTYGLIAWTPAIGLVTTFMTESTHLIDGVRLALRLLGFALIDNSAGNRLYAALVSLLVGMNVTLLFFYFKMYGGMSPRIHLSGSIVATLSALLGFGCAACGALFIPGVLGTAAGSWILAVAPLSALEFQLAGVALLLISSVSLVRGINAPTVCPI